MKDHEKPKKKIRTEEIKNYDAKQKKEQESQLHLFISDVRAECLSSTAGVFCRWYS
jgi:hypothetical protein